MFRFANLEHYLASKQASKTYQQAKAIFLDYLASSGFGEWQHANKALEVFAK